MIDRNIVIGKSGISMTGFSYQTSGVMVRNGISTRKIKAMMENGQLTRIKRGLYRASDVHISDHQGFVDIAKAVPAGVICLTSAMAYHELTTFNPSFVSVALCKGSRIPVIEYPPVEFHLFQEEMFELGIDLVKVGKFSFRIYDREKTVCDCLRFRNKIGFDLAREGLKEYLKRKDRNLAKLSHYAEICRAKTLMNTWLDILV